MTNLINYTLPTNFTDFPGAIAYSNTIMQQGAGFPFFGPLLLICAFIGFYAVSSRFTADRALPYSIFMTTVVAFLAASAGILDPLFVVYCTILLAAVVYFGRTEG
jgi:hypothetical protein